MSDIKNNPPLIHPIQVSCQFPIMDIWDLSPINPENPGRNGWEVTQDFPDKNQLDYLGADKVYNATVWARVGEALTFHTKFGAGSHIKV
jgi:hypothetical protein